MKGPSFQLSRRAFLGTSAGTFAMVAAPPPAATRFERIVLAPGSPLPLETAAKELSEHTGARIVRRPHTGSAGASEIVLVSGADIDHYREVAAQLPEDVRRREWELIQSLHGGLVIAGVTPRNVCRAALGWISNPAGETNRLSVYAFEERYTMWDNPMNQMYRFSKGFDRRKHIREIARMGHTGVEVNRYADPGGYWVRHRKFAADSYAWYISYAPSLEAFVESTLTKGAYPKDELQANLADLREAAQLARSYGLKPGFVSYEPRCVPERVFDHHPHLRGSRTDHPGRSLEPRYSLDIANPRVLKNYAELLTRLMEEVPDLGYFAFWTQDSGAGMPFASFVYAGPNGSYLARSKTLGQLVADFVGTLLEAGRAINPEFEVISEITWQYSASERKEVLKALPKGAAVSHNSGGTLFRPVNRRSAELHLRGDRAAGLRSYIGLKASAGWDSAPIIGVPAPSILAGKFPVLRDLGVRRIFNNGGIWSPPQCRFNINQELFAELIRGGAQDLEAFLFETAKRWCSGNEEQARVLVSAWAKADEALLNGPRLNWYHAWAGTTQGRWLTRPVVPDIARLSKRERAAWERLLFPLPWDIARLNISFEGGIRLFRDEDLEDAVRRYDVEMLPRLEEAIALLDRTLEAAPQPVIQDQRDRYQGYALCARTIRNLFEAQVAINHYVLKNGDPEYQRKRLRNAIRSEIENTGRWIRLLETTPEVFHVAATEESPFLYKTPLEDFRLKREVMQARIDDEPGPYLKELSEPYSERRLLFQD